MGWFRAFLLLAAWLVCGCARPQPDIFPRQIECLAVAPTDRIHHVRTGPDWESPDLSVGDVCYRSNAVIWAEVSRLAGDALHAPVAYVAGAQAVFNIDLELGQPGRVVLEASAQSRHVEPGSMMRLAREEYVAEKAGKLAVTLSTAPLPDVVDVLDLYLTYRLETADGKVTRVETHHPLALSWDTPIAGTPVYERTMMWASEWAAGTKAKKALTEAERSDAENTIARAMLDGVWALGDEGYRYGPFDRPKEKDNQAHVFLDFRTAACGEFRGVLLALNEYHGVEANWVMMSFRKPAKDKLSMYETRELPGVGTEPKVWRFWNHVAVEVNGRVYDPSYGLYAPDWNTYEDDLFARYCYGEDVKCKGGENWCKRPRAEGLCVDNPAGFDENDPVMGMEVWRGDKY